MDVRSYPGSRRYPQFNAETLGLELANVGIDYQHVTDLGGRRGKQNLGWPANDGWTHPSFRNYADYTLTEDYQTGLNLLIELAEQKAVAFCCSESVPWRCHRQAISNSLVAHNWEVRHIMGPGKLIVHELGKWGPTPVVECGQVIYPAHPDQLALSLAGSQSEGFE